MTKLVSVLGVLLLSGCATTAGVTATWVVESEAVARTDVFTAADVVSLRSVSDVEMSPSGREVAYVLRIPRPLDDHGSSTSQIWAVTTRGQRPVALTSEEHSSSTPRWSPDGATIAFLSKRDKDKHRQVYLLPISGGEATRLTDAPSGVGRFAWSPDGTHVAYSSSEKTEDLKKEHEAGRDWVIDEGGHTKARLFAKPVDGGDRHEVVTSGQHIIDFEWSPDSKRFAVRASDKNTTDFTMMYSALYTVDAAGGALSQLTQTAGKLGHMAWSPDGKQVAFLGAANIHDSTSGIVYVAPAEGGAATAVTAELPATGSWLGWQNAKTIVFLATQGTKTTLNTVAAAGGPVKPLITSGPICGDFSANARGAIACAGDAPGHPREVFAGTLGARRLGRLTESNPGLAAKKLGAQSVVKWKAADGVELEGILIHPVGYEKGKRYPLAVLPHGGPEGVSTNGWRTRATYPAQIFANAGYFVFEPNYRGSAGRGTAFAVSDQQDLGGKEFEDVLAGIDHLAAEGLIDPQKVGMGGWSYGGYFSGLAATKHTARFKAVMIGAAVINWISFTGTTEIEHENSLVHWNLWPWDDTTLPWDRSPLAHIKGAKTPALVVHGMADSRVPPGQGLEIYRGLKHHGVTTQLVMYPREPHGLIENVHSLDFINRFVAWFDMHVKGAKPTAEPTPVAKTPVAEPTKPAENAQ